MQNEVNRIPALRHPALSLTKNSVLQGLIWLSWNIKK